MLVILLCLTSLTLGAAEIRTVKLGVILPANDTYMFSLNRCVPAIRLALDKVLSLGILQNNIIKFDLNYRDSMCNGVHAPLAAFEFHSKNEADVFFGPNCDYSLAPVARYALYWRIPVITTGGFAQDFAQKFVGVKEYAMLTRVGTNFATLSQFSEHVMTQQKWRKIKLLWTMDGLDSISSGFCRLAVSGLLDKFSAPNFTSDSFNIRKPENLKDSDGINSASTILKEQVGLDYSGMLGILPISCWNITSIIFVLCA